MTIFNNFKLQIFRVLKELSDDVQRFDLESFFQGQIRKNLNDQNFQILITLLSIACIKKLQIVDIKRFERAF